MWEALARRTPSQEAIKWDRIVRELVGPAGDINSPDVFGKTPLLRAAEAGNVGVVEELRRRGADVEARTPEGWSALHLASGNGHLDVVSKVRSAYAPRIPCTTTGNTCKS
mmetsp:Transcript_35990/g.101936  ORF Transcript_35990/g.101936 Transcript_35990/m.101936 type:complete len:110 (-) Transcript_35990:775-1104(-)